MSEIVYYYQQQDPPVRGGNDIWYNHDGKELICGSSELVQRQLAERIIDHLRDEDTVRVLPISAKYVKVLNRYLGLGQDPTRINDATIRTQRCYHCGAPEGYECRNKSTDVVYPPHTKRYNAWHEGGRPTNNIRENNYETI